MSTDGRPCAQGHADAQLFSKMDLSVAATASYLLLKLVGYVTRVFLGDFLVIGTV